MIKEYLMKRKAKIEKAREAAQSAVRKAQQRKKCEACPARHICESKVNEVRGTASEANKAKATASEEYEVVAELTKEEIRGLELIKQADELLVKIRASENLSPITVISAIMEHEITVEEFKTRIAKKHKLEENVPYRINTENMTIERLKVVGA